MAAGFGITHPKEIITGSKAKGAVGAPRALISSEGRGITRPRRIITDSEGKGPSATGFGVTRHQEEISGSKERGPQARRVLLSLMRARNY